MDEVSYCWGCGEQYKSKDIFCPVCNTAWACDEEKYELEKWEDSNG